MAVLKGKNSGGAWVPAVYGPPGPPGADGAPGAAGAAGATGPPGPGVAAGGALDQVLAKASATDYATKWVTSAAATHSHALGDLPTTLATDAEVAAVAALKWTSWLGTQAAFDAIGTKDPQTLYCIRV